jgi:hypothetical protein
VEGEGVDEKIVMINQGEIGDILRINQIGIPHQIPAKQ